jgi:hypothetical protein
MGQLRDCFGGDFQSGALRIGRRAGFRVLIGDDLNEDACDV